MGPLVDLGCAAQATWVEMALVSNVNKEKLQELLDHSGRAYVVVQGEFYGPGLPDPKLPEAIKTNISSGLGSPWWIQNQACRALHPKCPACAVREFEEPHQQ
jgi:hypothetical protein